MLSIDFVTQEPVELYSPIQENVVFVGYEIKNLYDEKRLCISASMSPQRRQINDLKLFGVFCTPNEIISELFDKIHKSKNTTLDSYKNLIAHYNLTLNQCYLKLHPPLYPVDYIHVNRFIKDFKYEQFLCKDAELPNFQVVSASHVYMIVCD